MFSMSLMYNPYFVLFMKNGIFQTLTQTLTYNNCDRRKQNEIFHMTCQIHFQKSKKQLLKDYTCFRETNRIQKKLNEEKF